MNDKTRNKLNHILEAVPMSREHKNMLVEVFDEVSAGADGGGNAPLIIKFSNDFYDLTVNDKTFKLGVKSSNILIDRKCYNPELFNIIKDNIFSGKNIILLVHDAGADFYIEAIYYLKSDSIILGSVFTGDNLQVNIYNEYKDE